MPRLAVFPFFLIVTLAACRPNAATPPAPPPAPPLATVPVSLTVSQRSTTSVPGSQDRLRLTIGDITRNQVMVSLAADTGQTLLAIRTFSPGDQAPFTFAGHSYVLELVTLRNSLLGQDNATFRIASAAPAPSVASLSEHDKIEFLIQHIAALQGATFIRNGTEYSAAQAADHLRTKWQAKAEDIKTADQFIEYLASRSSVSGQPYQIRFSDGRLVPSGDYLRERLRQLSSNP